MGREKKKEKLKQRNKKAEPAITPFSSDNAN